MKHRFLVAVAEEDAELVSLDERDGRGYDVSESMRKREERETERRTKNKVQREEAEHVLSCPSFMQVETMKKVNFATNMINKRKVEEEGLEDSERKELLKKLERDLAWEPPECYTAQQRMVSTNVIKKTTEENELVLARGELVLNVLKRELARKRGVMEESK
jgi:hypothetical protein